MRCSKIESPIWRLIVIGSLEATCGPRRASFVHDHHAARFVRIAGIEFAAALQFAAEGFEIPRTDHGHVRTGHLGGAGDMNRRERAAPLKRGWKTEAYGCHSGQILGCSEELRSRGA